MMYSVFPLLYLSTRFNFPHTQNVITVATSQIQLSVFRTLSYFKMTVLMKTLFCVLCRTAVKSRNSPFFGKSAEDNHSPSKHMNVDIWLKRKLTYIYRRSFNIGNKNVKTTSIEFVETTSMNQRCLKVEIQLKMKTEQMCFYRRCFSVDKTTFKQH